MRKQILSVMLAGAMVMASLTGCGSSASGSGLPKNIELQVPAKAGGGTDVVARAIATQVGKDSGSNLTVQNNTDGSGVVAMEKVRSAKPDASSLLFFHTTMLIKTATGVYDHSAVDDFTVIAVGQGTEKTGYVLVVPAIPHIIPQRIWLRRQKRHREAFSWALRPAEAPTLCLVCLRRQPELM